MCLGEERHPFRAGDFVGLPAATVPHALRNTGEGPLRILVMGQRLPEDVADYPDRGKRLYRYQGHWDLVDLGAVVDPRGER